MFILFAPVNDSDIYIYACFPGLFPYQDWCILFTQRLFIANNENEPDESRRAEHVHWQGQG